MADFDVQAVTPDDYRRLARKRLPRFLFDYIDGAANEEITLAANVGDFRQLRLKQQVMRDVSAVDTRAVLLGQEYAMPLALAPVGMAGMMARRGEVQAVRAANGADLPFTLSTVGICSLEEVAAAATAPFWFQLYMVRDRQLVRHLLQRAEAAGCKNLLFTVDLAVAGVRHRDQRNGMIGGGWKSRLARAWYLANSPAWLLDVGLRGKPHDFGNLRELMQGANDLNAYKAFIGSQFDPSVTWQDIAWLRSIWSGKLVIKGIMTPQDALSAAAVGADGVIVSNHGGRQLDSVPSTISALPAVVSALGGRVEIYLDGGVRSGIDVVKAVALGANGVLIGRPWVWAVAAGGERGLTDLLAVFQREIQAAMALMGVKRIADLTAENLVDPDISHTSHGIGDHPGCAGAGAS